MWIFFKEMFTNRQSSTNLMVFISYLSNCHRIGLLFTVLLFNILKMVNFFTVSRQFDACTFDILKSIITRIEYISIN